MKSTNMLERLNREIKPRTHGRSGPAFIHDRAVRAAQSRCALPLAVASAKLTAAPQGASRNSGRNGKTAFSRTKQRSCSYGSAMLLNLTT
jgi:hypothetical protein